MSQQIINVGTEPNDNTGDSLRNSFIKSNDNFTELYNYGGLMLGTGSIDGGVISVNGTDNTTIDYTGGVAVITDYYTNPLDPLVTRIEFAEATGVPITNIATQPVTYIALDINGNVAEFSTFPTLDQLRTHVLLGVAVHTNNANVELVNDLRRPIANVLGQLHDLVRTIGRVTVGNNISPNVTTATLSIKKDSGVLYGVGLNLPNSIEVPNVLDTPALAPVTFRYRMVDGTETANIANIDPTQYELNGVLTEVTANKWSNQRVYLFPSNSVRVQWGQKLYNSRSEAIQGIAEEDFVEEQNIADNAVLLGIITIRGGATNLNLSTDASIRSTGKLGEAFNTATGASVTKLQDAYNNSVQPQIILDAVRLGMQIRDALTPITGELFVVSNNDGTNDYFSVTKDVTQITNQLEILNLPEYANDTDAGNGGLVAGDVYRTVTGELRVKL